MFSAGGPMLPAPNAMPAPMVQKRAKTRSLTEMSLRSTLPGRPPKRKSEALGAASCCAEDAAELLRARKPTRREHG